MKRLIAYFLIMMLLLTGCRPGRTTARSLAEQPVEGLEISVLLDCPILELGYRFDAPGLHTGSGGMAAANGTELAAGETLVFTFTPEELGQTGELPGFRLTFTVTDPDGQQHSCEPLVWDTAIGARHFLTLRLSPDGEYTIE